MVKKELTQKEIIEVFEKLQIPTNNEYSNDFEVWEVPPIKKGTQIFFESY